MIISIPIVQTEICTTSRHFTTLTCFIFVTAKPVSFRSRPVPIGSRTVVRARFVTTGHRHAATALRNVGGLAKCAHRTAHRRTVPLGTVCTWATDVHTILLGVCLYTTTRPFQLERLGGGGAPCVHSLLNVSGPCLLCIHQLLSTVTVQCLLFIETAFTFIYI